VQRKTFDLLATAVGGMLCVVLVAAGIFLTLSANFANNSVHQQLAQQEIVFPPLGSSALASPKIGPYLNQYAGQLMTTGPQAKAYADHFIGVHVTEIAGGKTYAQVSTAAKADPTNATLKGEQAALFQGQTLRGLLLEAYAFSVFGEIAAAAAVVVWVLAGLMLILTILGLIHFWRVPPEKEVLPYATPSEQALVTV
jgi:hypothetical protein